MLRAMKKLYVQVCATTSPSNSVSVTEMKNDLCNLSRDIEVKSYVMQTITVSVFTENKQHVQVAESIPNVSISQIRKKTMNKM